MGLMILKYFAKYNWLIGESRLKYLAKYILICIRGVVVKNEWYTIRLIFFINVRWSIIMLQDFLLARSFR